MSISPSEKVLVSIEDGIATLGINNAAANQWDLESLPALEAVVNNLNGMAEVRALVITGQGISKQCGHQLLKKELIFYPFLFCYILYRD